MSEVIELIELIAENVVQGRRDKDDEGVDEGFEGQPGVSELVEKALREKVDLEMILNDGLSQGMKRVGELYDRGEYFIPDMLSAAEAVGAAMEILEPYLLKGGAQGKGKVVMATVEQDQHDIGKNLVAIMLRGAGFTVVDLGVNVPVKKIIESVEQEKPQILGLSALLDTTMSNMEKAIRGLENRGMRSQVKVMIGGAPTSPSFASEIGADAHGKDAFAAVELAEKFVKGR